MSWLLNLLYWGALDTEGTECYTAGDRDAHAVPFQAASALSSVPGNTPRHLTSFGSDSAAVRRRTGVRLGQAGPRKHLAPPPPYKRLPPWSWRAHSPVAGSPDPPRLLGHRGLLVPRPRREGLKPGGQGRRPCSHPAGEQRSQNRSLRRPWSPERGSQPIPWGFLTKDSHNEWSSTTGPGKGKEQKCR